jgi:anti-anti-sigma factor
MAELDENSELTIERAQRSGSPLLRLGGELDSSNVGALESVVAELLLAGPPLLTFDLAGLRFMDSAGIAVLVGAAAAGASVELLSPSPIILRVLEATGLTGLLRVAP